MMDLNDLMVTLYELIQIYTVLEKHPRVVNVVKSHELFLSCREQVQQDVAILNEQMHAFYTALYQQQDIVEIEAEEPQIHLPWVCLPDMETPDIRKSVYELVKKSFAQENLLGKQLLVCLRGAQLRQDPKMEMQFKMTILSTEQRYKMLESRYGFASGNGGGTLLQGLKRQTTRLLSVLNGERED